MFRGAPEGTAGPEVPQALVRTSSGTPRDSLFMAARGCKTDSTEDRSVAALLLQIAGETCGGVLRRSRYLSRSGDIRAISDPNGRGQEN
jgi:hypothetical protein